MHYYHLVMLMLILCVAGNLLSLFNAEFLRSGIGRVVNAITAGFVLIYLVWIMILKVRKRKRHAKIDGLLDKN